MPSDLTTGQREEVAVTYASLILHDDGSEITADKLSAILKAANIEVQPFLVNFFAKVAKSQNIDNFLVSGGVSGGAAPAAAAPAAAAPAAQQAAPAEKKVEKKEEKVEEEEEEDMGFGLFD
eukprot:TRINITY_DN6_c0_g2_i1.p1 TRINITY_DN6_c0_g2~~TRINITY_DN6_c0_g2_i1.p1  ORF type:complete len:121 (+),score=47.77 TRINITY_DN6_c0_g2_i1:31-393(+)